MSCVYPLHRMLLCFVLVKAEGFHILVQDIRRFRQRAEFLLLLLQHCFPQMGLWGSRVGLCSFSNGRRKSGLRSGHSKRYPQTIHRIPVKRCELQLCYNYRILVRNRYHMIHFLTLIIHQNSMTLQSKARQDF